MEMEEHLVSLETARLLKEKGFNVFCRYCYSALAYNNEYIIKDYIKEKQGTIYENESDTKIDWNSSSFTLITDCISAPTQSLAQKWIRETKNIHVSISYIKSIPIKWFNTLQLHSGFIYGIARYGTYEEALEEGLKQVLKHL